MQRVLAMMCDICEAVQFAHEAGVLHRDLKPENIMLRPDGNPVVMDFGLAKLEDDPQGLSISMEGQIVGTIEYMAPEQAQSSKHVTERADVYSLGAILYQLLTGRKHFTSSGSILQDAQALQDYESPTLRQYNKGIDRDLETIVLKALRPVPVKRYTSVRHLLEDLKRYQAGDSITARAPTIVDRVVKRVRKHRTVFLFSAALLLFALIFGGYALLEYRKQWGDWTKEFVVDFTKAPPPGPEQKQWLTERFAFQDKSAHDATEPWPVRNGAMIMKQHEWCWLENVKIRDDTKVFVELAFKGKPEAFQICINSRKKLRRWDNNPPGYSCRVGIWAGSMDLITRNETDRSNDFNSLVVSALPKTLIEGPAGGERETDTRGVTLTFERQGEHVTLRVNGKPVHHETYLMPLLAERESEDGGASQYENIGIRTWGKDVEVRAISAYRFKLPEKASPTVAGDALAEAGHLKEAIEKYRTVALDYGSVSPSIANLALTKGYLLATHRGDVEQRHRLLTRLQKAADNAGWDPLSRDPIAEYLQKAREVEALTLWKEEKREESLKAFPAIFQADPDSRIVLECLRVPHIVLEPEVRSKLLNWTAKTTRLAGLNLRSLGLTDLSALASVTSLRGFDLRNNQVSDLDALRGMTNLRALYCAQNQITSLEPIEGLKLFEFFCEGNQIKSLAPVSGMPLETLYCSRNQITDLSPIKDQPLYALDCSENLIGSLEVVATLSALNQLYCSHNQITSLEPLRRVPQIEYLDCSSNQIESLEPLAGLQLQGLNCSDNRLVSLEPFVSAKDPPPAFAFDCETLPDAEIERAIAAWSAKRLKFPVSAAQLLLAIRSGRFDEIKLLASEHEGHRYLYVQKLLNADEAKQFCERVGGHLVTIASEEENSYLNQITPAGATCRIGVTLNAGKPVWVTGEPVSYVPDDTEFRPQDTLATWSGGAWISSRRDKPLPFIIEWD